MLPARGCYDIQGGQMNWKIALSTAGCVVLLHAPASAADSMLSPIPVAKWAGAFSPMFGDYDFGAFKIAENESPRPVDRVFVTYNYFNNVSDSSRTVIGFEKTFLDGQASVGMRLPFLHESGSGHDFGDVSLIFKYALFNDPMRDHTASIGLVVTVPTGEYSEGVKLQPFAAWQRGLGSGLFIQGFHSVVFDTYDYGDTILFNDIGLGYALYRAPGQPLSAVTPKIELHLNAPLGDDPTLNLTAGVHATFYDRWFLGAAVSVPLANKTFDVELMASLNYAFGQAPPPPPPP